MRSFPPVRSFLILVFLLSWPLLIIGFGWFGSEDDILVRYLFSCAGMLMVALSAAITRAFIERKGFKDVGWSLGRLKWYPAVFSFLILLWLSPLLIAALFGQLELNRNPSGSDTAVIIMSLAGISLLAGFGEEFGWRGYLLPRLLSDPVQVRAGLLLVGLIWGMWHCAVAIGPFIRVVLEGDPVWTSRILPTLLSCLQMIGVSIALSYIFGALWLWSRSIFLMSFFHGYWICLRDSASILFTYPALFQIITLVVVLSAWFVSNRWLETHIIKSGNAESAQEDQ